MLLVSFCDILTISISGLFMATIITVFEAVKIPEFRPTPRAVPTNKTPVFFECRNNEIFYVDKDGLDAVVAERLSKLNPGLRGGDLAPFLKMIQQDEIGNRYYTVDPKFLLVGIMALAARPDVRGEGVDDIGKPSSMYQGVLDQIDKSQRYIAFLVRDDSFALFRTARTQADRQEFDTGWELLGPDEPIKFGATGQAIAPQ